MSRSSLGLKTESSSWMIASLVTPADSALKVVMTRWRSTGMATAVTSEVVA